MSKRGRKLHLKKPRTGEFNYYGFKVIISHPLPDDIDIEDSLRTVARSVPSTYYQNLDCIYVGDFSFLESRKLTAMYKDGTFYVSNKQDDADDLADDLVHETAHLVEEDYGRMLYADGKIEREFLQKRKQLYHLIESQKEGESINYSDFLNPDYTVSFDNYLYNILGYDHLALYTVNLFYSPYAVTSLREYFANGFEAFYYYRELEKLKNLSPALFSKLVLLEEEIAN